MARTTKRILCFGGYDVEASGMAIDRWFELSGLSICTLQYGGFISLTDIRHQGW